MRLITPDDVHITRSHPTVRIGETKTAKQELSDFVSNNWGTGDYGAYVDSILSLFERVDGTYGLVDFVTFIISPQYRKSFMSVHSVSDEYLAEFAGFEDANGVYEFGELTENIRSDIRVQ